MAFIDQIQHMDKRLRMMLVSTALLIIPQIGQFAAIRDLNFTGRESDLATLFMLAALAIIPTSVILTSAILFTIRRTWREHQNLLILGLVNLVISISLGWFIVSPCSWAAVFGLYLRGCH
jgi:hypothetical protein